MSKNQGQQGDKDLSSWRLEIRCHKCGEELPLLHPHIMVERYDEDENMICEWCYMKHSSEEK